MSLQYEILRHSLGSPALHGEVQSFSCGTSCVARNQTTLLSFRSLQQSINRVVAGLSDPSAAAARRRVLAGIVGGIALNLGHLKVDEDGKIGAATLASVLRLVSDRTVVALANRSAQSLQLALVQAVAAVQARPTIEEVAGRADALTAFFDSVGDVLNTPFVSAPVLPAPNGAGASASGGGLQPGGSTGAKSSRLALVLGIAAAIAAAGLGTYAVYASRQRSF